MTSRRTTLVARSDSARRRASRAGLAVIAIATISVGGVPVSRLGAPQTPPAVERDASREPERSRTTAVVAAVDALYALTIPAFTDRRRFEAAARRLAAARTIDRVRSAFGEVDPDVVAAFADRRSVLRGAPLGYRIDTYDGARASVAIWSVAIAAAPNEPPQSQWRTLVVDLEWTPAGWRVTNGVGIDGPAPDTPQRELAAQAASFRSLRHVP